MKIRICITDDHTLFRGLLKKLVATFNRVDPDVKEARNGRELLDLMGQFTIDVAIVDLSMPVLDGRSAALEIVKRYPDCKILILTMTDAPRVVVDLMEIGVHGYILKDCDPEEVERAILAVVDNDFYHNDVTASAFRLAKTLRSSVHFDEKRRALSARELEVLIRICSEQTTRQISECLHISPKTVEHHRINILKKVGVRNTVGLVKFAYEQGILALDSSN